MPSSIPEYWNGVQLLRHQYSGVHAPYGLVDGSVTLSLMMKYFWQTTGPLFCLLAILGIARIIQRRQYLHLALLVAPSLFYLGYFSLQHVFFERNVSHIVPLLAICFAAGLVYLSELIARRRVRQCAFAALLLLSLAPSAWTSGRLIFVAMPTSTEDRARLYEQQLTSRVGYPIGRHTHLLSTPVTAEFAQQAAAMSDALLLRVLDYHDSYTAKHVADLLAAAHSRQVGYFPSVFESFSVNTLITNHSPAFRYLLLSPPPERVIDSYTFVPWTRAGQVLAPDRIELGAWAENAAYPQAGVPPRPNRFFGSYTAAGDANRGAIHLGPFFTGGFDAMGIPLVTGPVAANLSLSVSDHATGRILARMAPPPVLREWRIWLVDLRQSHPLQIDIAATDNGAAWGEWLALAFPLRVNQTSP
jgi:hypothetical protein